MYTFRTGISKSIFAASLAICIAMAAGVLHSRFSGSDVEAVISGATVLAQKMEPPPSPAAAPKKEPAAPAAPAPTPEQVKETVQPQPQPRPESPEALAVRNTVTAFYNDYLRLLAPAGQSADTGRRENMGARIVEFLYERPEVERNFAEKVDRLVTSLLQDPEIGHLPSDPVVMSRDVPRSIELEDPTITDNRAELIAYALSDGGKRGPICLSLIKSDAAWKIENINDMSQPGGLLECGGKKAAPQPEVKKAVSPPISPPPPPRTQQPVGPARPPARTSP